MCKFRLWRVGLGIGVGAGILAVSAWYAWQPVPYLRPTLPLLENRTPVAKPIQLSADPQYLVINFAPMNELPWAVDEATWQSQIKPEIVAQVRAMQQALPPGNDQRRLAWSTLMEYLNFPLDTPSPQSPYALKLRRIFEITEELAIPVFVPLNGFQWWDELPELYNWWDSDGTKTDERFFARQDNPIEFKRRFVAGYDAQNRVNVEWQDWQTPMQLNWRNWGEGGFRLAPPPNIVWSQQTNQRGLSYRLVQQQRYELLVQTLVTWLRELEASNRLDLFAGMSIGTEVSLNASATPKDEFEPYGYQAMRQVLQRDNATSAAELVLVEHDVLKQQTLRQQAIRDYLTDLSWLAVQAGVPKSRIYTHVWSEALSGEVRYQDYAASAYNAYSRPGISLYGYATKPFALPVWLQAQKHQAWPAWGAVEYSLPKTEPEATQAVAQALTTSHPQQVAPQVVVFYNWDEHNNPTNLGALKQALVSTTQASCVVPEFAVVEVERVEPIRNYPQVTGVRWQFIQATTPRPQDLAVELQIYKTPKVTNNSTPVTTLTVDPGDGHVELPVLAPGAYTAVVVVSGCEGVVRQSTPTPFSVSAATIEFIPRAVDWWLRWQERGWRWR